MRFEAFVSLSVIISQKHICYFEAFVPFRVKAFVLLGVCGGIHLIEDFLRIVMCHLFFFGGACLQENC